MYVLIGEQEGDYGDFYQRNKEVLAASDNEHNLWEWKEAYTEAQQESDFGHVFIEFYVEEIPHLGKGEKIK